MTGVHLPWYFWILLVIFVVDCVFMILVILFQSGKGGGLSSLMGGASALSDTLGATGAERALRTWTTRCAVTFAVLAIVLALIGARSAQHDRTSLTDDLGVEEGPLNSILAPLPEDASAPEAVEEAPAAAPEAQSPDAQAPETPAPDVEPLSAPDQTQPAALPDEQPAPATP